jgi:hypothetical protein
LIDGVIKPEEYRAIITNFEAEINALKKDKITFSTFDDELPQYTQFATQLFSNLDQMYVSADLETKSRLLGWMYPEKIIITKEGVPTPNLNKSITKLFNICKALRPQKKRTFQEKLEKSNVVTSSGFKPETFSSVVRCFRRVGLSYEANWRLIKSLPAPVLKYFSLLIAPDLVSKTSE